MLSNSLSNLKAKIFTLKNWADLFLIGKNVLIAMVPILINKDLFESSYNAIKFMVQNGNYLCTNLNILRKDILFYLEYQGLHHDSLTGACHNLHTAYFSIRCLNSSLLSNIWARSLLLDMVTWDIFPPKSKKSYQTPLLPSLWQGM